MKLQVKCECRDIESVNESSRISNMIPLWIDRNNRRRGLPSKYDNSLKGRIEFIKLMQD